MTEYNLYQWSGNNLIRQYPIDNPYADCLPESYYIPQPSPECDCVTIRRTMTNYNGDKKSAVIESFNY